MSRYKARDLFVEAVQFTGDNFSEICGPHFIDGATGPYKYSETGDRYCMIPVGDGLAQPAFIGDWIIKDEDGNISILDNDAFEADYEPVPTVQPSLSTKELVEKIREIEKTERTRYQTLIFHTLNNDEAASLIDQAIEDAANPYKEAFEELVERFEIEPADDDGISFDAGDRDIWARAPLTRALLTKEEKSDGRD